MQKLADRIASVLARKKNIFFLAGLFLFLPGFLFFKAPVFDGRLDGFGISGSENFRAVEQADSLFGLQNRIWLLVHPASGKRNEVLEGLARLHGEIHAAFPQVSIDSPLEFYREMPAYFSGDDHTLHAFLARGETVPLLTGLVDAKSNSFLVLLRVPGGANFNTGKLDNVLKKNYPGLGKISPVSSYHLSESIAEYIRKDLRLLTAVILGFFLLYFLLVFRKPGAIVHTAFSVGSCVLTCVLLFGILHFDLNLVSVLAIPVVLILSLSDSVHLLSGWSHFHYIADKQERLAKVLGHYIVPSFFSSATTSAAFYSFCFFNDSVFIREFGLVTGTALLAEFLFTFLLSPFLLYHFDPGKVRGAKFAALSSWLLKYRKPISAVMIASLLLAVSLSSRLQFRSNTDLFFPLHSEIAATHDEVKKNFYTQIGADLVISETGSRDSASPELENYVRSLSAKLRVHPQIREVNSVTDTFFLVSPAGFSENLYDRLGKSNPYYNDSADAYRVELWFASADSAYVFCSRELPEILASKPKQFQVSCASPSLVMNDVNAHVSASLLSSLAGSVLVILLFIFLLTRSLRITLLSLIPNLVPVGIAVLIYFFSGMSLNIMTAMTAVVCIGLLDDDTIHILYRRLWLKEPLNELSFSILSTAFLLAAGFGFFLLSNFQPTRVFGWVSALIFLAGVFSEITLFQFILDTLNRKKDL